MKTLIVGTLLLALASTLGVVAAEKQPRRGNSQEADRLSVMGGAINTNFYADVSGQRVYFCCGGCSSKFKQDPESTSPK
jgi:YHS domain-containing protein